MPSESLSRGTRVKQLCPLATGDVGLVISGDGIECGKGMRSGLALVIVSL